MAPMPTVEIFDHLYNIRGECSADRIRTLARYVDRRMRQIDEQLDAGDALRIAVLAALNIANDYYETQEALEQREGETLEQAQELTEILGDALGTPDDAVGNE